MSKRLREKSDQAIEAHAAKLASGRSDVKFGPSACALKEYMLDLPAQARRERDG